MAGPLTEAEELELLELELEEAQARVRPAAKSPFLQRGMGIVQGAMATPEPRPVSRMEAASLGAQRGGSFATADEAEGVRNALNMIPQAPGPIGSLTNFAMGLGGMAMEALPGQPPQSYTQGRDTLRAKEEAARAQHPVTFGGSEIAASVLVPVGGTARAATKTGQVIKGTAAGAGSGAVYSFAAEDGSLEERAKAGAVGGAVGGAFGGLLSAIIPRDIPLSDVLNTELFGTKVSRPVLKTIERMLVDAGVPPNRVEAGVVNIRQRLQSSQVGAGLPTRFKDELVKEFGDSARGVSKAIETQIRGGAARSGSASDTAVERVVNEDNAAARELFSRSVDQFAGSTSRPELRGQAIGQLENIVEQRYKPILARPIADPTKQQALIDVLNLPRMKTLASELAEDAEREGIDLAALIARNPADAAHWMQSKARQLADDRGAVTITGAVKPDRIMSNRRKDILDALEDAVPGYRETRLEYGDKYGVTKAINFAKGFLTRAKDDVAVADMAEEFADLSEAQKQMAVASLRSVVTGSAENVRYVDPELGASALRTAEIGKEPVLKALSEVFGEQGTKLADDIKAIVSRTDANRRINPQATGSDTVPKNEAIKFAMRNTRGPIQRTLSNVFGGAPMDLLGSAMTGGPTPISAARVGLEGAGKVADNRAMSTVDKVTELLLSQPQNTRAANALLPPGAPPAGGGQIINQLSPPPPQAPPPQAPPPLTTGAPAMAAPAGAPVPPPKPPGKLGTRIADSAAVASLAGAPIAEADTGTEQARITELSQLEASTQQQIAAAEQGLKHFQSLSVVEKQRFLRDNGFTGQGGAILKDDGATGGNTTYAINNYNKQMADAIAAAKAERENVRGQINDVRVMLAEQGGKTPNPMLDKGMEFGSYIGAAYLAHRLRGAGISKSQKSARAVEDAANSLLTRLPVPPAVPKKTLLSRVPIVGKKESTRIKSATTAANKAAKAVEERLAGRDVPPISSNPTSPNGLPTRVANVDEFDRRGAEGLYGPVGPIGRFVEPVTSRLRTGDLGVMGLGAGDAYVMEGMLEKTRSDIKTQETELQTARKEGDANRITAARAQLEKLRTIETVQTTFQRVGIGLFAGAALGVTHGQYAKPRPRFEAAARERDLINRAMAPAPIAPPPPAPLPPPPMPGGPQLVRQPPPQKPRAPSKPKPKPPVTVGSAGRPRKATNDNDR
jgi:hypothetical protein